MKRDLGQNAGIQLLLKKYRNMFKIPENLNYYSQSDYKVAEKKFLKFVLMEGKIEIYSEA